MSCYHGWLGPTGYDLKATPSLTVPVWTGAGAPTVVAGVNYVTNSLTGTEKYYRLEKP